MLELTDKTFDAEVLNSNVPVLVDFWAHWCGPCRAMMPTVEKLAATYEGRLKVAKINIDECEEVPQRFNIPSVPTFMIFKDGEIEEMIIGAVQPAKLEVAIAKVLK